MSKQIAALRLWAFVTILYYPVPTSAYESQFFNINKNICRSYTSAAEKKFNIPKHLLSAISLAESGRWDKLQKENIAWPWTITSGGKGRFYDTKEEALAEVETLLSKGIKNIDVGCMQVNLYYHGSKFKNFSEAIEPGNNVAYAANYLKKLYSYSGDWEIAMGNYHSTTPSLNKAYRSRVLVYLPRGIHKLQDKNISLLTSPAPIDYQRMARLNASFHARTKNQSQHRLLNSTNTRQLNAWREARIRGNGMGLYLAKRRAVQKLNKKRQMERLSKGGNSQTFKQRRTQQLKNWRLGEPNHWKKDSLNKTRVLHKK